MVEVEEVLAALSNTKRIKALELVAKGTKYGDIARTIGISGAGLSRYLKSFAAAKLVEKTDKRYMLLPLGEKVLEAAKQFEKSVSSLVLESNIAERKSVYKELVEGIKQTRMLSGRSLNELEKAVERVVKEKQPT